MSRFQLCPDCLKYPCECTVFEGGIRRCSNCGMEVRADQVLQVDSIICWWCCTEDGSYGDDDLEAA